MPKCIPSGLFFSDTLCQVATVGMETEQLSRFKNFF